METAIRNVSQGEEFLYSSRILIALIYNILDDPFNEKYRRLRIGAKLLCNPDVVGVLMAVGFEKREDSYVLRMGDEDIEQLQTCVRKLIFCRHQTGIPQGWDIPTTAIHYSRVLSICKYGDIFSGRFDNKDVAIKTLKPDCSAGAKEAFRRELDILIKLDHPNVIQLVGATLSAETNSILLELVPHTMLDILHKQELTELQLFQYVRQVADGMLYIHSQDILHCDLAAHNILVSASGEVKICDFSQSCVDGSYMCEMTGSKDNSLNLRWAAPEVLQQSTLSKHSDVWSYGVLMYEFFTSGSVPYANLSNTEVRNKVVDGYRLPQPPSCSDELYTIMTRCWNSRPTSRPLFPAIVTTLLAPLEKRLQCPSSIDARAMRPLPPIPTEDAAQSKDKKPNNKKISKVKELNFFSIANKGGELVRLYTSLVVPSVHRTTAVCAKKTTVMEVIQLTLNRISKADLDPKSYAIALLDESSNMSSRLLNADERILSIKSSASSSALFVLCGYNSGMSVENLSNSIKQNPSSFDRLTRGYLLKSACSKGAVKPKSCSEWHQYWCVLDGSSLLCYDQDEDEAVKQYVCDLNLRSCTVAPLSEKYSNYFRVELSDCDKPESFLFSSTDKPDMLRWVEAISSSTALDPSPILLQDGGGTVFNAGFLSCLKFPPECDNLSPLQPMMNLKLGQPVPARTTVPINYGRSWSVLKSSGLVQSVIEGRPVTLLKLSECHSVRITNPRSMKEGAEFSIRFYTNEGAFVLRADMPTDHWEWVTGVERVVREIKCEHIISGNKCRESAYIALKRLILLHKSGVNGSQLSRCCEDNNVIHSLYTEPDSRDQPDGCEEDKIFEPVPPLPPRTREHSAPPLPPRDPPPSLPPKRANSLQRGIRFNRAPSVSSMDSNGSSLNLDLDEYIVMQSPRHTAVGSSSYSIPSPISEGEDYLAMKPFPPSSTPTPTPSLPPPPPPLSPFPRHKTPTNHPPVQRILLGCPSPPSSIPGSPRPAKRSALLRTASESSNITDCMPRDYAGPDQCPPIPPHRNLSPLPPRRSSTLSRTANLQRDKITYGYPISSSPSPLIHRSNSALIPADQSSSGYQSSSEETSSSDGLTVNKTKQTGDKLYNQTGSSSSVSSELFDSSASSSASCSVEDLSQALPAGWERGYCQNSRRYFFFNTSSGVSTWEYSEVLEMSQQSPQPGKGWSVVSTTGGRVYYYHDNTRQTTWNIQDTYAA